MRFLLGKSLSFSISKPIEWRRQWPSRMASCASTWDRHNISNTQFRTMETCMDVHSPVFMCAAENCRNWKVFHSKREPQTFFPISFRTNSFVWLSVFFFFISVRHFATGFVYVQVRERKAQRRFRMITTLACCKSFHYKINRQKSYLIYMWPFARTRTFRISPFRSLRPMSPSRNFCIFFSLSRCPLTARMCFKKSWHGKSIYGNFEFSSAPVRPFFFVSLSVPYVPTSTSYVFACKTRARQTFELFFFVSFFHCFLLEQL